ncbi:MAG: hypothetical protein JWP95_1744, partial [Actinotalea sp.]|nr:hypothetical protein [Actinotalea sp.]
MDSPPDGRPAETAFPATVSRTGAHVTDERLVIGDVVDWRRVATLVRALGATVEPGSASWSALERLVLGLTDPLRRLDTLAAQLRLAVRGDDHAADGARAALGELAPLVRTAGLRTAISGERGHGHGAGCRCGCGCAGDDDRARPVLGRGERSARPTGIPAVAEQSSSVVDDDPGSILDEEQLAALLLAAVLVAGPDRRQEAADVVAGLVLASALVTSLGLVHAAEGEVGLVDRLESLAGQGLLAWVGTPLSREPVPMQTMSGQMPGGPGGIPGLPPGWQPGGLPGGGIPGIGGIPGAGLPGVPDLEDPFGDLIDALLGRVKGKRRWDPEKYDHSYPWWIEPQRYIDPRTAERVRCVLEVNRQLAARNEPAPARPTPAVWSEGITEVSLSGPCAGATITITGVGFGSTRPAGVTLLLPTLAGCRPATADSWSDTRITATLPADVGSGPVGFADAAYVAAVDAWAARRNAADAVLATLTCATYVPTLTRPFHECPPPTAINAILAGVPVISAFTANGETVLPLEPGVPLVLRWSVQNAQTLTVERVSASGPGFAGSSSVADPPASQWALGTPSYSTLQVWTYRLTATGACGGPVSREVTVVAGKRPRLRIEQI